jgi:hypothetical protein
MQHEEPATVEPETKVQKKGKGSKAQKVRKSEQAKVSRVPDSSAAHACSA